MVLLLNKFSSVLLSQFSYQSEADLCTRTAIFLEHTETWLSSYIFLYELGSSLSSQCFI